MNFAFYKTKIAVFSKSAPSYLSLPCTGTSVTREKATGLHLQQRFHCYRYGIQTAKMIPKLWFTPTIKGKSWRMLHIDIHLPELDSRTELSSVF